MKRNRYIGKPIDEMSLAERMDMAIDMSADCGFKMSLDEKLRMAVSLVNAMCYFDRQRTTDKGQRTTVEDRRNK